MIRWKPDQLVWWRRPWAFHLRAKKGKFVYSSIVWKKEWKTPLLQQVFCLKTERSIKQCLQYQKSTIPSVEPMMETTFNHQWERVAADLFKLKGTIYTCRFCRKCGREYCNRLAKQFFSIQITTIGFKTKWPIMCDGKQNFATNHTYRCLDKGFSWKWSILYSNILAWAQQYFSDQVVCMHTKGTVNRTMIYR